MLREIKEENHNSQIYHSMVESELLQGNRAGMSPRRPLTVYLPKAHAEDPNRKFPVLYCLAPWTSAGREQLGWQAFRESLRDRLDRLISEGRIAPVVVVCPDLYTDFGGSQYINSSYFGPHGDHIVKELIPFVEKRFPVKPGSAHRGVFGRSSGGFGALRFAMDYPGAFAAVGCHSGDLAFDILYRGSLVDMSNGLKRHGYDASSFIEYCRKAPKLQGSETHVLMLIAMAGFYSPNPHEALGFDLPLELYSGRVRDDVWQRWLQEDPVTRIKQGAAQKALKDLTCLYVECGFRDQYNLHYGARQFHELLDEVGIKHVYQEFDDNHSGTAYRYDVSLPLLTEALK